MEHEISKPNETIQDPALRLTAESTVEMIGSCTQDIADCEIMRAAIANKNAEFENKEAQAIRIELAKRACSECVACYLSDIDIETNNQ